MNMGASLRWNGALVTAREKAGAARGLYLAAEHVLEESKRIVPIAPSGGTLERSGKAHPPGTNGLGPLQSAVTYDTPYAVVQHEHMEYHHTRPGAQAKYLETPLNAEKAKCEALIAAEIRKSLI